MVQVEKVEYGGWPNCFRLSNGTVDLIATTDVGPRVIRFGFVGSPNEFHEVPEQRGRMGGETWLSFGGHRLWHAPEHSQRSYVPDNLPVDVEILDRGLRLIQPVEKPTGIQKEIVVALSPDQARAKVTHRLTNRNLWAVELAPWALSVMAPGGVAILPQPPRGDWPQFLLPSHRLVLWAFTNMEDPRWTWGEKYILLRQDPTLAKPQKIGLMAKDGWIAYARDRRLFVKTFTLDTQGEYPDLGCSVETFTNAEMLEIETLGPKSRLIPGATAIHIEEWHLLRDIPAPTSTKEVDQHIGPMITRILPGENL